jgi:hypothetical protein
MRALACAAACLPVGFGVAVATGIRPLGGLVLVALAALAGHWSQAPRPAQIRWYLVVLACFIASHLIALALPAWVAVAIVTVIATAAFVSLCGRRRLAVGGGL